MSELAPSHAGPRPPDGGRPSSGDIPLVDHSGLAAKRVLIAATAGLAAAGAVVVAGGALAWSSIHTVYALRYARLYYAPPDGGIDFHGDAPDYGDFAYLALTVGMTFQVSDTALTGKRIRRTALHHALLSYVFGAVILAITVNLLAPLLGS